MIRQRPTTAVPPGLVIRPYAGEGDVSELVRVLNAEYEADHVDERRTEEGEREWLSNSSEQFNAARDLFLAELKGRVVAVAGQDWVDTRDGEFREYRLWGAVFTRRAWRRRGLARSLIAKSLILLRERGMTSAELGVDADNPLGALGLYERAGFAVSDRFNAWRKPMDEGNE